MPKISVLMPLYDAKEFLAEAIESILNQTFQDFEFIIVDDSSDGSYDIAKKYAGQDDRIKLIKNNPPLGLRKSSNLGIKEAKGKYIARMEADDISLPNRLEKQLAFMEANPEVDVSGCFLQLFDLENDKWVYPISDREIKDGLIWGITIAHPTTFMKRAFLVEGNHYYNPEGLSYAEDREFFFDMHKHATFKNLPEFLYMYRRSANSVTKRTKPFQIEQRKKLLKRIFDEKNIFFEEKDLEYHMFIEGGYSALKIDKKCVRETVLWYNKLFKKSDNKVLFRKVSYKHWDRIFYKITTRSVRLGLYFLYKSRKLEVKHLMFLFRVFLSRLINR